MTCDEVRDAVMTAEPRELRADGDGPLAAHLAECPACAKQARMLSSVLPRLSKKATLRSRQRAAMAVGIPAAAAAVVLGVFIARPGGEESTARPPASIPTNVVSVDVKAGQRATVLKTSDPKVTVVWISPGGSE
jgi:hypothetical protein